MPGIPEIFLNCFGCEIKKPSGKHLQQNLLMSGVLLSTAVFKARSGEIEVDCIEVTLCHCHTFKKMLASKHWLWINLIILCLGQASLAAPKKVFRCPSGCSCSKETIICVGTSSVPRTMPNDINSL